MNLQLKALLDRYPLITEEKAAELLTLFNGDMTLFEALLGRADEADRRAKSLGVAYKAGGTSMTPPGKLDPHMAAAYDYCDVLERVANTAGKYQAHALVSTHIAAALKSYPRAATVLGPELAATYKAAAEPDNQDLAAALLQAAGLTLKTKATNSAAFARHIQALEKLQQGMTADAFERLLTSFEPVLERAQTLFDQEQRIASDRAAEAAFHNDIMQRAAKEYEQWNR